MIIQNRRHPAGAAAAGAAAHRHRDAGLGRAAAGNDHGPSAAVDRWFLLLGRHVHRRRTDARRGLHRCPLRGRRQKRRPIGVDRTRRDGFLVNFPPNHVASIDAGVPIKVLTGLHSGCLELIAKDSIHSVTDLRGKRVGVDGFNNSRHVWLSLMAAYVGLDPVNDIQWVSSEDVKPTELFVEGKIDAFLGTPPQPQELRAKKIGHTILNNAVDRPWSQYFCCMISAHDGLREQVPGGDQAGPAGHPQGRRPLRVGSAMGGAADGRSRFRHQL